MRRFIPDWLLDPADRVLESLWFLPVALTLGSLAGSGALLLLDNWIGEEIDELLPILELSDISAIRSTLETIGSSIINLTGVVFSITIFALSLTSQQFGPRLLRAFMRDRGTQLVLGTFIATYLHTMVVQHALDWSPDTLPRLSIHAAVLLGAFDALLLVYFLNHVGRSIQVGNLVGRITEDLLVGIDALCPEADEPRETVAPPAPVSRPIVLHATGSGYMRVVQFDSLIEICQDLDGWVEVLRPVGEFVIEGAAMARVHCERASDEQVDRLRDAFALGNQRTPVQDLGFPIDQLVELALRALSPGIHDPETAIACIHRLGQGLARIANRPPISSHHFDEAGALRVTRPTPTFESTIARCFDRIARAAAGHPEVRAAIESTLAAAGEVVDDPDRAGELARYEPPPPA